MLDLLGQFSRRRVDWSVEAVREAHRQGNAEQLLHASGVGKYAGDFVFGGIDGVVTTFAIVAGVAGAELAAPVVLVLGLANLLADGFAMGIGNYLSIRSGHEHYARERQREAWEIEHIPDEERKEVEAIYRAKGFTGEVLQQVVATITADKERWLTTMMRDELKLTRDPRSPWRGGLTTYLAFVVIGFVPLLSFVLALATSSLAPYTFSLSLVLTVLALFAIGATKSVVVDTLWWRAGSETLLMGGLAALVAYLVGFLLKGVV